MADTTQVLSAKAKWIIAGIILLILLTIAFFIYRAGKKKGGVNVSKPLVDNPNNTSNNNIPAASNSEITSVAESIFNDMKGLNWLGHNIDLWNTRVLTMSDTDFSRLYDEYNKSHQVESGLTMRQWVSEETDQDPKWLQIKEAVLIRMNKLNFK
jgi:hypothetical protein